MTSKKLARIFVLILAIAIISGCIGQTQDNAKNTDNDSFVNDRNEMVSGNYVIFITKNGFDPVELIVPQYATVIWKNTDTKGQTVFFNDTKKGSPSINPERSWSYKFNETGEYPYYSSFYVQLKGKVIVR
ncbi:MAG: cupredoxin domain-containing protein [Candidatus Aenigmatarchaeota archaeon]